ncbi:MAG: hypothetical protein HXN00_00265 [Porphyromonadaceae bacterium]|nr:hypothetical protein [Porphyromonadaceae bacterium]
MLSYLTKALYARYLARWMRLHPTAIWYLINTSLNYGRLPHPIKLGGAHKALYIRRHQTTIIIRRTPHGCALDAYTPDGLTSSIRDTDNFAEIITRTRGALARQEQVEKDWSTIR